MNPRAEAYERLGGRYAVRVLEPSPPAVDEPPWFADDPVAGPQPEPGRKLVSPVGNGDLRWEQLAADDRELAEWCAERWLAAYRRLGPAPATLTETRLALHELAERVISPARRSANGKIGLRYTRGGFGTPFFGDDAQVRVDGAELVRVRGEHEQREPICVDVVGAAFLAEWYGFAVSVLEELRAESGAGEDPSRVQLWPEHFDMSVDLGSEEAGARATHGLSPGDDDHLEPYLYVVPWLAPPPGELWRATAFTGAELRYSALLEVQNQRETALEFFRARLVALSL